MFALYLLSRIYHLSILPPFSDEVEYAWRAQIASSARDLSQLLISYAVGKPPLHTWLVAAFLGVTPDPILAGRLVSVVAGAISLFVIQRVGAKLYGARVGLLAAFFYLVSPFMLFHDRMLLLDSLVNTFGLLTLWFTILLFERPCRKWALLLGLAMGLGLMTKTSAAYFCLLPPLGLILLRTRQEVKGLWRWLEPGYLILLLVAIVVLGAPLLAGYGSPIGLYTATYHYLLTPSELLGLPLDTWSGNLASFLEWQYSYLTPPIFFTALMGLFLFMVTKERRDLFLSLWFFIPSALLILTAGTFFSRYVLFTAVPLLVLVARLLDLALEWVAEGQLSKKLAPVVSNSKTMKGIVLGGGAILLSMGSVSFDYWLLEDPVRADWPGEDRFQYIEGWPAGYGLMETMSELERLTSREGGVIITVPLTGSEADMVNILWGNATYGHKNPKVIHEFMERRDGSFLLPAKLADMPAYVVVNEGRMSSPEFERRYPNATLLASFPNPSGKSSFSIYELAPAGSR